MVCKDDEIQGNSKEPMRLILVQNIINDNGGQNFDYFFTPTHVLGDKMQL
jgi:hypothetical protein